MHYNCFYVGYIQMIKPCSMDCLHCMLFFTVATLSNTVSTVHLPGSIRTTCDTDSSISFFLSHSLVNASMHDVLPGGVVCRGFPRFLGVLQSVRLILAVRFLSSICCPSSLQVVYQLWPPVLIPAHSYSYSRLTLLKHPFPLIPLNLRARSTRPALTHTLSCYILLKIFLTITKYNKLNNICSYSLIHKIKTTYK